MNLQQLVTFHLQQIVTYMAILELLLAIPLGLTLKRIGLSPFWALLSFIPLLGIPALWVMAVIRWPRDAQPQR